MEASPGRFLSVEIVADPFDPVYRIKYIEQVEERGAVRFEKHEGRVLKNDIDGLVAELIRKVKSDER